MNRSWRVARRNCCLNTRRNTTSAFAKSAVNMEKRGEIEAESGYSNRSPSPSSQDAEPPLFKRIFKQYKARDPRPSLDAVIDLREANATRGVRVRPLLATSSTIADRLSLSPSELTSLGLKSLDTWTLSTLDSRPGLFVLNDVFQDDCAHLEWLRRCLHVYPESPNITNLSIHSSHLEHDARNEKKTVFDRAGEKLRWTTVGLHYDWVTKEYPESGQSMPVELRQLGTVFAEVLNMGPFSPDAMIINYYPEKATLSPHVDRSERVLSRPLISVSLGQSAIYLTGGTTLDAPVSPLFLHSGDVLVMAGEQRLVYHAVPAILPRMRRFVDEHRRFDPQILDYANRNRVNMTIRQVDESDRASR